MAFTYRKPVSFNVHSDGLSKKLYFDFSKIIASDPFCTSKISFVDSVSCVYATYEAISDEIGANISIIGTQHNVTPIKVSVHSAIVEMEFANVIPPSSINPPAGSAAGTTSALGGTMVLVFEMV